MSHACSREIRVLASLGGWYRESVKPAASVASVLILARAAGSRASSPSRTPRFVTPWVYGRTKLRNGAIARPEFS